MTPKIYSFLLTSSAPDPSRLFRELLTLGHVGCSNNCLLSSIMEQENTTLVMLNEILENALEKTYFFRNHEQVRKQLMNERLANRASNVKVRLHPDYKPHGAVKKLFYKREGGGRLVPLYWREDKPLKTSTVNTRETM